MFVIVTIPFVIRVARYTYWCGFTILWYYIYVHPLRLK